MSTVVEQFKTHVATQGSKSPVFVVGCPRSGTSLLYHSLLSGGGFPFYDEETHFFSGLAPRVGNLKHFKNRKKLIEKWRKSDCLKVTGIDREEVEHQILNDCRNSGDFLRIVMDSMARSQNAERWSEKTPDHVLYLREIKRTIPNALFIHIIRDGRDVALSLDGKGFLNPYLLSKSHSLLVCGIYWEWLIESGRSMAHELGSHYMEVRFEDLVNKPRESFARVGHFIGQDLDHDQIRDQGVCTVSNPNTSFNDSKHADGFNPVDRWKQDFPPAELHKFEALLGESLLKLGYALSTTSQQPKDIGLWSLRTYYRSYFSSRLWMKTHNLPLVKYFVRDRYLAKHEQ